MNTCNCYETDRLPDIAMYAGDTTPWEIAIMTSSGEPYQYEAISGGRAVLSIIPYAVTSGYGTNTTPVSPVVTMEGSLMADDDGHAYAMIEFGVNTTVTLRGKYIYQIEIYYGTDLRVSQGVLQVKQNINRA